MARTINGGVPLDAAGSDDSELTPYRSWALQQSVISLLDGDTEWRVAGPEDADESADELARGNAALLAQLEPDPEIARRIRSMVILWVAALVMETFNHFSGVGVGDSEASHFVVSGMIVLAIAVTVLVFPRLSFPQFIVVGQVVLLYAYALIAIKVAGTGGMDSPYALLWALVTLYVSYFVARVRAFPNLAVIAIAMLTPFLYDETTDVEAAVYLGVLVAACLVLAVSVMAGREISRGADKAVRYLALADPLTGVANLRSFEAAFDQAIASPAAEFALVVIDVNGVKGAVAAFGHETGDDMLQRTAKLLRQACGERDQVARVRGDEFAVLLDGADEEAVAQWRNRLESLICKHNEWARNRLPRIEVETGVAFHPRDGDRLGELEVVADARSRASRASVVRPPYEVDTATPHDADELLKPDAEIFDPRIRQLRNASSQAGVRWLLTAAALCAYLAIPGIDARNEVVIASTAAISLLIALWGFAAQSLRRPFPYFYISDVMTLLLIVPNTWGTGGWQSPIQPAMIFPVAFYVQFMTGRPAVGRVAAAITLYSFAIWTSDLVGVAPGPPDELAKSLYLTIVIVLVVITVILQRSRHATDDAIATIRRAAIFDPLTGARNVHAFRADLMAMVKQAVQRTQPQAGQMPPGSAGSPVPLRYAVPALLIADIDDFRGVNNRAGHLAGDAVLKSVTERLRKTIGNDAEFYRIDSDEFAVVYSVEDPVAAQELRERIERAFGRGRMFELRSGERVSLSLGGTTWREGDTAADLVQAAEAQLDVARSAHRDVTTARGGAMLL